MALAIVQTLPQLMAVRVISSLGLGVLWPTAFSLLSDLFERKESGRAADIMTAVSFSGTIVSWGSPIAGYRIHPQRHTHQPRHLHRFIHPLSVLFHGRLSVDQLEN